MLWGIIKRGATPSRSGRIHGLLAGCDERRGELALAPNSPVVYGGDLNMVGLDDPIYTLVSGDISDENTYGPDFNPDWDGTALTEQPFCRPITGLILRG